MIVDDVITAGTAIREVMEILRGADATPAGIVVALDRQERGTGKLSAIQEIEQQYAIPVIRLITLAQVISYLVDLGDPAWSESLIAVQRYRDEFGV